MLIVSPPGTRPSTAVTALRDYGRHWTPVHLDFVVPDLAAAAKRARAAGATQEGRIEVRAWNSIAYMTDPWGNGFDLIELPAKAASAP